MPPSTQIEHEAAAGSQQQKRRLLVYRLLREGVDSTNKEKERAALLLKPRLGPEGFGEGEGKVWEEW